jgi:hypothetical protein
LEKHQKHHHDPVCVHACVHVFVCVCVCVCVTQLSTDQ